MRAAGAMWSAVARGTLVNPFRGRPQGPYSPLQPSDWANNLSLCVVDGAKDEPDRRLAVAARPRSAVQSPKYASDMTRSSHGACQHGHTHVAADYVQEARHRHLSEHHYVGIVRSAMDCLNECSIMP